MIIPCLKPWFCHGAQNIARPVYGRKLKHFRRVATRYDKLAVNFLAMVQLASLRLWLSAFEAVAANRR